MTLAPIKGKNFEIGCDQAPFIIAEISGNHGGSLQQALTIVDAFVKAGASAVKIQTYTADTMTIDCQENAFFISDSESLWQGESLYDLYDKAHTPWEWHKQIFDRCAEKNIPCFSSPFDESAVDFLEELNVPLYKVASFECTDIPLIKRIAQTKKPTIVSTGMATLEEIEETVTAFREAGGLELILLKCSSSYPADPCGTHLNTMRHLSEQFGVHTGLSDHTLGIGVAVASVALGARVIEKHVTLSRDDAAVDSAFSLEPFEFSQLVDECHKAWKACGSIHYGPNEEDKASLAYRRSLYICEDMKEGETLTSSNLRRIRPGLGLAPKYYESVLGKTVKRDVRKGTPLSWDLI